MGISKRRAAEPPPGVSVLDAWTAGYAIPGGSGAAVAPTREQGTGEKAERKRSDYDPCRCGCRCGSVTGDPGGLCYMCKQDAHHRCSRACRAFEQEMTVYRGVKALTNYIPARRECDGGTDGPEHASAGRRRI